MIYLVKHKGGVEIQVTEEIYKQRLKSKDHKCRIIDNTPRKPEPPKKIEPEKWPKKDKNGPWYTLSNGKRIKGKANAVKEQDKL